MEPGGSTISLVDTSFPRIAKTGILKNRICDAHTEKQDVEKGAKMSSDQQNSVEKLSGLLTAFSNYWRVQKSLTQQRPDLVAVAVPFALRLDFDQVVSACRPALLKTAQRIVRNREIAEDVVQEALRKAYSNLKRGRPYVLPKNRV